MPAFDADQIADVLEGLESRPLVVASGQCARQRHRRSSCALCIDACPVGAIAWNDGLEIDWEACTGCGICSSVCPTGALEASAPSDEELLVQIQRVSDSHAPVVFACPHALEGLAGGAQWLTVSCLGRLNDGLLVSAASNGAQGVWLLDGACAGCPQSAGRAVAGTLVARANMILEAFDVPVRAAFRHEVPSPQQVGGNGRGIQQGISRRGMFKALARQTARATEIAAEASQNGGGEQESSPGRKEGLPKALPSNRVLLLAALQRLGIAATGERTRNGDGAFTQFQLGQGCTACQMCAYFCPTGALTRVVDGNRVGLAFRASHCVDCGLCRDICYRDAVLRLPEVDLNKLLTLAVDWCFAEEMDAEPWKRGLREETGKQILEALGRSN